MNRRRAAAFLIAAGALAAGLGGCTSPGSSDPVGEWGGSGEGEPRLVLDAEGTFTGSDGCNTLNGEWASEGDQLAFTGVSQTLMACQDTDTWLGSLSTATLSSTTLTFFDEQGREIGTLSKG